MAHVSRRQVIAERTAVLIITVIFLLPVAWLITTAYKPSNQIFSIPPRFDFTPTLAQFTAVLSYFDVFSLVQILGDHQHRHHHPVAAPGRAGRLCAGPLAVALRDLFRLLLFVHPHGAGHRLADPVLPDDARHRPAWAPGGR